MLGTFVEVKITSVGRWSIFEDIVSTPYYKSCVRREMVLVDRGVCENLRISETLLSHFDFVFILVDWGCQTRKVHHEVLFESRQRFTLTILNGWEMGITHLLASRQKGQVLLQLSKCGASFGQIDLFKFCGKFDFSYAYEDYFNLPKGWTVIIVE